MITVETRVTCDADECTESFAVRGRHGWMHMLMLSPPYWMMSKRSRTEIEFYCPEHLVRDHHRLRSVSAQDDQQPQHRQCVEHDDEPDRVSFHRQ